jgi:hypothetical protein
LASLNFGGVKVEFEVPYEPPSFVLGLVFGIRQYSFGSKTHGLKFCLCDMSYKVDETIITLLFSS